MSKHVVHVEDAVLRALACSVYSTSKSIGRTIGADKFLVLDILARYARQGVIHQSRFPRAASARELADRQLFRIGLVTPDKIAVMNIT